MEISSFSFAQVTVTGSTGADGSYTNLRLAFAAVNANPTQGGNTIVIAISASITDNSTAVLYQPATSVWNSLTIYPIDVGIILSGTLAGAPLFDLNGADNVIIDGRMFASGTVIDLTLANASTSSTGATSTVRFINSASNNTVQYCNILGSSTNNVTGNILFSTGTTGGNNYNLVRYCNLTRNGTSYPYQIICSIGTAGLENTGNSIENNNIFNFLSPGALSYGIFISTNNESWNINGNSFYQTVSFVPTGSFVHKVIYISDGDAHVVSNNNIGGSAQSCGGSPWTKSNAFNNAFTAIELAAGITSPSYIDGNTIKNFTYNNGGAGAFTGISVSSGFVNIGSNTGNIIGDSSSTGSITYGSTTTNAAVYGIANSSTNTVMIDNNVIAGITTSNTSNANASNIVGINVNSIGNTYINNNFIGSYNTANSINASCISTTTLQYVYGIWNSNTGNLNVFSNKISNLKNSTTNSTANSACYGIYISSGISTISKNSIRNLTNSGGIGSSTTGSVIGVNLNTATNNHTISENFIYGLSNTHSTAATHVYGIQQSTGTGTNLVSRNFIHSLASSTSSATGSVRGINVTTGNCSFLNNIISLTFSGNGVLVHGIRNGGGTNNIFFNTISLSGTTTGSTADAAIYTSSTNVRTIKNNIFSNTRTGGTGTHNSIYVSSTSGLIIGYNDYVGPITGFTLNSAPDNNSLATSASFSLEGGNTPENYESNTSLPALAGTGYSTDYFYGYRTIPQMGAIEFFNPTQTITTSAITPTSLCQGGAVSVPFTITGTFSGGNTFTAQLSSDMGSFDNPTNIGTLVSTTSGTINATIPGGTTYGANYRIRVIASNPMCTGSDNGTYLTVNVKPTAGEGPDMTICFGGNTPIGGSPTASSGTPPYTYSWTPSLYLSSPTASNPTVTGTVPGVINYSVVVTDANACVSDVSSPVTVTVNPLPAITASASPAHYCQGSSSTLTASGASTYSWTPATGLSSTNSSTVTTTASTSITYTVYGTTSGCMNSDTVGVTVYPTPSVSAGPDQTICAGSPITMAGTYGGSASSASWTTSGTGTFSDANSPSAIYTPSAADILGISVTLTFTTNDPTGPCSFSSDPMTVTFFSKPSITYSNTNTTCPASCDAQSTLSIAGGTPSFTYLWSASAGSQTTVTATALCVGAHSVIVTDANGCTETANITIIANPIQTFIVTTTADAGAGSLREAITNANANCGHDTIVFNLGAGGPFTINLSSALPTLTDNSGVTINGFENGANDGTPNSISVFNATAGTPMNASYVVAIGNAANIAVGLNVSSNNNVIKGLVLQDFGDGTPSSNDIAINVAGHLNKIIGCIIGLDATGTTKGTKTNTGIYVSGNDNQIGNGTAAGANIISGMNNSGYGIYFNSPASRSSIEGNMIGLKKDGETITGVSQIGINFQIGSDSSIVGGGNVGEGNVISGNNYGVRFNGNGAGVGSNVVGNVIGPRANGLNLVTSNSQQIGVYLDGANFITIGGSSANERNIISANEQYGVAMNGAACSTNVIKGNYIGIASDGVSFITGSSQNSGIYINVTPSNNTIGGSNAGEGNIISGNNDGTATASGIYLSSSSNITIKGNIIGLQADGNTYVTNNVQNYGVYVNGSANNIIGGNSSNERNIISANQTYGVYLSGAACSTNVIKGNYIGIASNGTNFITSSTQDYGVYITSSAANNTIGGDATAGEGNVISGNNDGISTGRGIYSNSTAGNTIKGNIIGTQADGISYVTSNLQYRGIELSGSPNNVIGGNSATDRNIISANETHGVFLIGAACSTNVIKGNYIGLASDGAGFISGSTQDYGVAFSTSAIGNTIGGDATAGEENVISGNSASGIFSSSSNGNTIKGNIIGPQADGNTFVTSNVQNTGVNLNGSANNIIGGNTSNERNIISANETHGVYLSGVACSTNVIKGNYIGLASDGINFITGSTQDYGVYITSSAVNNIIGGNSVTGESNIISGNKGATNGYGIYSNSANGNIIKGNTIGPQSDGNSLVVNSGQTFGVNFTGSANNIVGGNSINDQNIISANNTYGVYLSGAACSTNVISGNIIGLAEDGVNVITGNSQDYGVYITSSASNNTIGGSNSGEGNVISGNSNGTSGIGLRIVSGAFNNYVKGNIVGPQANGQSYVTGNLQNSGIELWSNGNTIGGNSLHERNVISGNVIYGVYLSSAACSTNVIKGNYIGLASDGTSFIAGSTQDYGVYVTSSAGNNTIGGDATIGEGNVISGNKDASSTGRGVFSNSTNGNTIIGNIIGPRASGTDHITSNAQSRGIELSGSRNNIIGGSTSNERNIISANLTYGVLLTGTACSTNVIKGNYIGLASDGASFITSSNQDFGVFITSMAGNNTIGGINAGEGNVISGNNDNSSTAKGIYTNSLSGNSFFGNIIGTRADGLNLVTGNLQSFGLYMSDSPNNIVGGNSSGYRNIISGNTSYGVYLTGASATSNSIKGNYIGININGTAQVNGSVQNNGVFIDNLAGSNSIGGSNAGEGNVISGNNWWGVYLKSAAIAGNSVIGNIIGPQADGVSYVPSNDQNYGIHIENSKNNIIGGNSATHRNIISGNEGYGIALDGGTATGNSILGNYIGIASDGTSAITGSSQDYGLYVLNSASSNAIGTINAGEGNKIAFNTAGGLYLTSVGATANKISGNVIYSNGGKPIELNYGASQANNGKSIPVISSATSLTITGTSSANDVIELFKNTSTDCYDAESFITAVTADGSGNWTASVSLNVGDYVLATSRDASNNSSEFSTCLINNPEYFWVGDAGNWSEFATHWATSSGGSTFFSVLPNSTSIIHFDSNSFTTAGQIITMDINATCKSILFEDVNKTPVISGTGSISTEP